MKHPYPQVGDLVKLKNYPAEYTNKRGIGIVIKFQKIPKHRDFGRFIVHWFNGYNNGNPCYHWKADLEVISS